MQYDVISMRRYYALSEILLLISGRGGAAIAQYIGFKFQVSGFGCQGDEMLYPGMRLHYISICQTE